MQEFENHFVQTICQVVKQYILHVLTYYKVHKRLKVVQSTYLIAMKFLLIPDQIEIQE